MLWRALGAALLVSVPACAGGSNEAGGNGLADNVSATSPPPAPGVSAQIDSLRAVRGENLEFAIYTYGPGEAVFEKFGHIALAMRDTATGEDIAFNWGMFDFDQPHFLRRFLTGDTRYWMAGYDTRAFNAIYQRDDRSIRRQTLALSPVERGALQDYLSWNAAEENMYYRYDYYRDNCSTRVRDILDWALSDVGGLRSLLAEPADDPSVGGDGPLPSSRLSWREETARITASDLPVYAGIEIALGRKADLALNAWDAAFLPEHLAADLAGVSVNGVALIASDTTLFVSNRPALPLQAPSRVLGAWILGIALTAFIAILSNAASARALLAIFGVLWYAIGGVVGTLLLLAATVTKHAPYMGSNLSLLVFNPLLLLAAIYWPFRHNPQRTGRAATGLSAVVALLTFAASLLIMMPVFSQNSLVVIAVTLPVNVMLALSARSSVKGAAAWWRLSGGDDRTFTERKTATGNGGSAFYEDRP